MAKDEIYILFEENPIILQTSNGLATAIGRSGPPGQKGDDGISWELVLTMTASPNGTCNMALYKNGMICSLETHYAYTQIMYYDTNEFVPVPSCSTNITGSYSFDYTNVKAIFVTIFDDSYMEKILCANSVNYGRAATVSIGNVIPGQLPTDASVTNSGTPLDAVLDFVLPKGDSASIRIGNVTTLPLGANATVENVGTDGDAVLDFGIPNGVGSGVRVELENMIWDAGAFYWPSVSSDGIVSWTNNAMQPNPDPIRIAVNPKGDWSNASQYYRLDVVRYQGYSYIAKRDVPAGTALTNATYWMKAVDKGDTSTITVGTVTTGAAGSQVSITNRGTNTDAIFDFTIPRGDKGNAATVAVGNVTTGTPETPANVTNSGTANDAVFDFTIPKGKAATVTVGNVRTGAAGSQASVTNRGTTGDAVFDFVIPRGEDGNGYTGAQVDEPNNMLILERSADMLHDMAFADDAPEDGKSYFRKDADWEDASTKLNLKANLASPTFTGTPKAPTAADGTSSKQIATTEFVQKAFKANDAMIFKGTIGSSGATVTTLPATHNLGWTYKVITAGSYAGHTCEIGDMIICNNTGTTASDSDWSVIQSNIDGAVTGAASSTDNDVAIFDGTSGKVIKDSGFTIGKSVPSDAKFTDTTYSNGNGIALSGTTFSANFPTSGTPAALGTASNGTANTIARSDHVHAKPSYGNINTSGAITADTAVASGDKIIVADSSASSKLIRTGITFDGSTTNKALTPKGTWEEFTNYEHPTGDGNKHVPANGTGNSGKFLKATGTAGTYEWDIPQDTTYDNGNGINLSGTTFSAAFPTSGTPAALGTASNGTSNNVARADHVHAKPTYSKSDVGLGNVENIDQSKAIKSITRDGLVYTYTCLDNTTGTFTQQAIENERYDADAVCSTPAATAAKVADANSYVLAAHNRFTLRLTVANTAKNALTLNVNNTGAKPIVINGIASSTSNYNLPAGDYQVYYDGAKYYLRTDGVITGNITGSAIGTGGTVTSVTIQAGTGIEVDDSSAITVSGVRTISNSGVRSVGEGTANGTISVNTNGTSADVPVKGLGTAAFTASTDYAEANHTHDYLPLSGGTVTGTLSLSRSGTTEEDVPAILYFKPTDTTTGKTYTKSYIAAYNDHGSTTNGTNVVFHTGGNLFIGSGEAPAAHYKLVSTGENTFITSDVSVLIQGGGNTIGNRKGLLVGSAGGVVPLVADVITDNSGSLGTSAQRWANVYAVNLNGVAIGSSPEFTDSKVTNTVANTTKYYMTGTSSASTNTGTQVFDTGIYATTTAGQLNATTYKVNEQVTMQWNASDESLDFVFA